MSKKKRKRQTANEDEVITGANDDGEFDDGKVAAGDSEQSDDDDIAADSMIKVTLYVYLVHDSHFTLIALCQNHPSVLWHGWAAGRASGL